MGGKQIFTIGHSNRGLDELVKLLKYYGIEALVDVRHFPRSRHNPQFNKEALENKLPESGVRYLWIENLGGFRKGGFEEYIRTKDFQKGLEALIEIANQRVTALMCAELLWFRCHRCLIASLLESREWQIIHIYDEKKADTHRMLIE